MSENYIVINGKRAELTREQMEQLGIEVKGKKRWRATNGGVYYFVNISNATLVETYDYGKSSDFRYYSHNYFETREEAEAYARVLETEMLLKKYADEHNGEFDKGKYDLCINKFGSLIINEVWSAAYYGRPIWFSSNDIASNAIKEIGEERIEEYLTYEW